MNLIDMLLGRRAHQPIEQAYGPGWDLGAIERDKLAASQGGDQDALARLAQKTELLKASLAAGQPQQAAPAMAQQPGPSTTQKAAEIPAEARRRYNALLDAMAQQPAPPR